MSKQLSNEEFIKRVREIHGDKYDLSHVFYTGNKNKVVPKCYIHGEFSIRASHLLSGHGCKRCASSKPRKKRGLGYNSLGLDEFIRRARKIHGNKYDYSKVKYINCDTPVIIICPIHGEFLQTPYNHLNSLGCQKCTAELMHAKQRKNINCFLSECRNLFGDMYDYSKIIYVNNKIPISLICKKCGNSFKVTPHNHLIHKEGCPFCKQSKMENSIKQLLKEHSIVFEQQKVFNWLIDGKSIKRLDFYLPEQNIAIECQGLQHFKPVDFFGGEERLMYQQKNDSIKRKLCEEHNIKILYYSDVKFDFPYDVITNKEDLMEKLKKAANRDN